MVCTGWLSDSSPLGRSVLTSLSRYQLLEQMLVSIVILRDVVSLPSFVRPLHWSCIVRIDTCQSKHNAPALFRPPCRPAGCTSFSSAICARVNLLTWRYLRAGGARPLRGEAAVGGVRREHQHRGCGQCWGRGGAPSRAGGPPAAAAYQATHQPPHEARHRKHWLCLACNNCGCCRGFASPMLPLASCMLTQRW